VEEDESISLVCLKEMWFWGKRYKLQDNCTGFLGTSIVQRYSFKIGKIAAAAISKQQMFYLSEDKWYQYYSAWYNIPILDINL